MTNYHPDYDAYPEQDPTALTVYDQPYPDDLRAQVIASIEAKRRQRQQQPIDYHNRIAWGTAIASAGIASFVEYEMLHHTWGPSVPVVGLFFAMIGGGTAWTLTNLFSSTGFKLVDAFLRSIEERQGDERGMEEDSELEEVSETKPVLYGQSGEPVPSSDGHSQGQPAAAYSNNQASHHHIQKEKEHGESTLYHPYPTRGQRSPGVAYYQRASTQKTPSWRALAETRLENGFFRLDRGKLVTIPEDVSDLHIMRLFEMRWKRSLDTVSLRQLDQVGISRSKEPPNAQTLIRFLKRCRLIVEDGDRKPLRWTPLGQNIFPHQGKPLQKSSGVYSGATTATTAATTYATDPTNRVGE